MTREEAINYFKRSFAIGEGDDDKYHNEVLEYTIKALEQEPVLDKIRAEIKALSPKPTVYDVVDGNPIKETVWEVLADVLQIIDKYKAESKEV